MGVRALCMSVKFLHTKLGKAISSMDLALCTLIQEIIFSKLPLGIDVNYRKAKSDIRLFNFNEGYPGQSPFSPGVAATLRNARSCSPSLPPTFPGFLLRGLLPVIITSLNHFQWLLLMWRSSGLTLRSSLICDLFTSAQGTRPATHRNLISAHSCICNLILSVSDHQQETEWRLTGKLRDLLLWLSSPSKGHWRI